MAAAQPQAAAVAEAEAVVEVVEAMSVINGAQPALDLSDEIKEASFYVLLRALLDAASMLGSVNVVELAMWARWKMKYDTPQLAFSGPPLPALPKGASDELLHWLNVSSAAYKYSRTEFCATSGIPMSDLIATDLRSSTMRPAYVVCLDHAYEAIVLAIRGTHGLHDLLTDAAASNTAFLTGYAHSGMAHAVATLLGDTPVLQERAIVSSIGAAAATNTAHASSASGEALLGVARLLASCMKQHPSYRVVVCGHSLGGGVAALLTMRLFYLLDFDPAAQAKCGFGIRVPQSPGGTMPSAAAAAPAPTVTMHDDDTDDGFVHVTSSPPACASSAAPPPRTGPKSSWPLQPYPLHCFVFGPPPVASADVCEHFEPHITSTVMGADFVPRVSMHMLHQLRAQVDASRQQWWEDAVVDLAASRVGQLSSTAVQHISHALLAAKDLSSAALGAMAGFLQQRFAGGGVASDTAAADAGATGPADGHVEGSTSGLGGGAQSPAAGGGSPAVGGASPGGSSVGSSSEASEVYAELARDFIRSQHPNSTAGAAVDAVLRVGIQQGHPERVLGSGDDILQSHEQSGEAAQEAAGGDPLPPDQRSAESAGEEGAALAPCSTPPGDEAASAGGAPAPPSTAGDSTGTGGAPATPSTGGDGDAEGVLPTQVLSLPGTILHVTPHEDAQVYGYEARLVPPSHFQRMLFTHDMWQHHKRRLYGRALAWINLRDTPRPRVQLRLPVHLVPGSGSSSAGAAPAASASTAPAAAPRPVLQLPADVLPRQSRAFDAEAFLQSVVGSTAHTPPAPSVPPDAPPDVLDGRQGTAGDGQSASVSGCDT